MSIDLTNGMTPAQDVSTINSNLDTLREAFDCVGVDDLTAGGDFVTTVKANFDLFETICSITMPVSIVFGITGRACREGINLNHAALENCSLFTSVVSITLITTANPQTTSLKLKIDTGGVININWGDGNTSNITGDNIFNTYSHQFNVAAGKRYIRISGELNKVKSFSYVGNENWIMNVDYLARFSTLTYLQLLPGYVQRGLINNFPVSLVDLIQLKYVPGSWDNLPSHVKEFRMLTGMVINTGSSNNWPEELDTVDWTGPGAPVEVDIDNLPASIRNLCLDGSQNGLNVHGSMDIMGTRNPTMYYFEVGSSLGVITGTTVGMPAAMRDISLQDNPSPNGISGDIKDIFKGTPILYTSLLLKNAGVNLYGNVEELPLTLVRLYIVNTPNVIYNGGAIPAWVISPGYFIVIDNAWTTAMIDAFLIACAASLPNTANIPITLTGTNQGRSTASNAAVVTLTGKGYVVTTN